MVSLTANSHQMVAVQSTEIVNTWLVPDGNANLAKQILSGGGAYSSFSWTPDNKIVYVSANGGKPDIWQMDADGSNQKQITNDGRANLYPAVSLDGKYIVYTASRDKNYNLLDVWRMDADGGNPKQLTHGDTAVIPRISPDGKFVVYSGVGGGKPTLWKVATDGGEPVQLTTEFSQLGKVSPDGNSVACYYFDDKVSPKPLIAIIPIEGGAPIKTFKIRAGMVRWMPDGRAITFVDSPNGISNIFSQPIDGGAPKQLTQFNNDLIFLVRLGARRQTTRMCARIVRTMMQLLCPIPRVNRNSQLYQLCADARFRNLSGVCPEIPIPSVTANYFLCG